MNKINKNQIKTIIVFGMHRSGTSLFSKYLTSSGLYLGDKIISADVGNPLGYNEDAEIDVQSWNRKEYFLSPVMIIRGINGKLLPFTPAAIYTKSPSKTNKHCGVAVQQNKTSTSPND